MARSARKRKKGDKEAQVTQHLHMTQEVAAEEVTPTADSVQGPARQCSVGCIVGRVCAAVALLAIAVFISLPYMQAYLVRNGRIILVRRFPLGFDIAIGTADPGRVDAVVREELGSPRMAVKQSRLTGAGLGSFALRTFVTAEIVGVYKCVLRLRERERPSSTGAHGWDMNATHHCDGKPIPYGNPMRAIPPDGPPCLPHRLEYCVFPAARLVGVAGLGLYSIICERIRECT